MIICPETVISSTMLTSCVEVMNSVVVDYLVDSNQLIVIAGISIGKTLRLIGRFIRLDQLYYATYFSYVQNF